MNNKPSIIIAGGRTFNDYDFLRDTLDETLLEGEDFEIVSGGARGVDSLGERYAKERGHSVRVFPADWDKHGKAAGPIRNEEMAKYADGLVAFWDGSSRGTKSMIEKARTYNLEIKIIRYE